MSNQIRYVGKTKQTLKERLKGHFYELNRAIKLNKKTYKHNWLNKVKENGLINKVTIHLIETCDDNSVNDREIYWINELSKTHKLTNTKEGGDGGRLSEEARKKISFANSGVKNGMYGKRFKRTKEHNDNARFGLLNSDKLKQSRASLEYKEKISNIFSKPLVVLDMDFNVIKEFKNSLICADFFGFTRGNITNAVRSLRKIGKSLDTKYWVVRKELLVESIEKIKNGEK